MSPTGWLVRRGIVGATDAVPASDEVAVDERAVAKARSAFVLEVDASTAGQRTVCCGPGALRGGHAALWIGAGVFGSGGVDGRNLMTLLMRSPWFGHTYGTAMAAIGWNELKRTAIFHGLPPPQKPTNPARRKGAGSRLFSVRFIQGPAVATLFHKSLPTAPWRKRSRLAPSLSASVRR